MAPATQQQLLGVDVDTETLEMAVPDEKRRRYSWLVAHVLARRSVPTRMLETLTGCLAHAARVIKPGRLQLAAAYAALGHERHRAPAYATASPARRRGILTLDVTPLMRCELRWWQRRLRSAERVSFAAPPTSALLFTDASPFGLSLIHI